MLTALALAVKCSFIRILTKTKIFLQINMKTLTLITTFFLIYGTTVAQTDAAQFKKDQLSNKNLISTEYKKQFASADFSQLWTHTDNKFVYGFIGENFQRLRIKFLKVTKDGTSVDTYHVSGKTMVKNNITDFEGIIKISTIKKYRTTDYGVDGELKNKGIKGEFVIVGDYTFSEDKNQSHSGVFSGVFATGFYLDKTNKVQYDDIEFEADGYANNEFVGTWVQYGSNVLKKCNWGDYRIPYSGNFDGGAGEFSPGNKYFKYGWENFEFMYKNDEREKKARQRESARWW